MTTYFFLQSHLKTVLPSVEMIINQLVENGDSVAILHEREVVIGSLADKVVHYTLQDNKNLSSSLNLGKISEECSKTNFEGSPLLIKLMLSISEEPEKFVRHFQKTVLTKIQIFSSLRNKFIGAKLVGVPGRGILFQLLIDLLGREFNRVISYQNAYMGRYYTYSKMLGDYIFVLDNHAKTIMVEDFQIKQEKVVVSGNPRYLTATDSSDEISYDASAPWTILVFGQPGIEQSFSIIFNEIFSAEKAAQIEINEILFRPHPRQLAEQIDEVLKGIDNSFKSRISISRELLIEYALKTCWVLAYHLIMFLSLIFQNLMRVLF